MKRAFQQIFNNRKLFFPIIINSTVTYILAFLFSFMVYQVITIIGAASCNIHVRFLYNGLRFVTGDYSSSWTSDTALIVFISGPAVSIIMGLTCFFISQSLMGLKTNLKLFFLWTSLHFFNRVLSFFILGNIFFLYGPNLILDWLYFSEGTKIIFSGIAFILLIVIGMRYLTAFIHSANNINLVKQPKRFSFLLSQTLIPFVIGNIFMLFFFFPKIPFVEVLINLFVIVIIVPIFFKFRKFPIININEPLKIYPVDKMYIFFLVGLAFVYRLIFIKGFTI